MKLNRKSFLKRLGMGTLAATGFALLAQSSQAKDLLEKSDHELKLGLASYSLRKFELGQVIVMTKRLGLKHLALKDMQMPLDSKPELIKSIAAKIRAAGIDLIVLSLFSFASIQAQTTKPETPCACCTEAHRQFDFWLGDWEAYVGDKLGGTNKIVMLQDSCIIQENWVSASGVYTGTSYNYYNTQSKTWHQTWVDNQGGSLELSGSFKAGRMVLQSKELTNAQGQLAINRISWTPNADGTVRQHWEVSTDKGRLWTTVFDGLYKQKQDAKTQK